MIDEVIATIGDIQVIAETETRGTIGVMEDGKLVRVPNRQLHAIRVVAPTLRARNRRGDPRTAAGVAVVQVGRRTLRLRTYLEKTVRVPFEKPLDYPQWGLSVAARWEKVTWR